jgi:hypothetical protein
MIFTSDTSKYAKALMAKPITAITRAEFGDLVALSRNPRFELHHDVTAFLFENLGALTDSLLDK